MTATSRRALLSAFAAFPAVALPVAAASSHPDAELLELGRQHAAAGAVYDGQTEAAALAEKQAEVEVPPPPVILPDDWYTSPRDAGQSYTLSAIERWRAGLARDDIGLSPASMARFRQRGAAVVAAWDNRLALREDARQRHDCASLDEAADAAGVAHYGLERRIFATPARTPDGLRVKAQIAVHILGEESDGTYEDQLMRSILADLLALA